MFCRFQREIQKSDLEEEGERLRQLEVEHEQAVQSSTLQREIQEREFQELSWEKNLSGYLSLKLSANKQLNRVHCSVKFRSVSHKNNVSVSANKQLNRNHGNRNHAKRSVLIIAADSKNGSEE